MLLLMSISAWVVIFWKGWLLTRARRDWSKRALVVLGFDRSGLQGASLARAGP